MGQTLARNGDGKGVSRKEKERKKDERVGELESQVESSYCRHLHGHHDHGYQPSQPMRGGDVVKGRWDDFEMVAVGIAESNSKERC